MPVPHAALGDNVVSKMLHIALQHGDRKGISMEPN